MSKSKPKQKGGDPNDPNLIELEKNKKEIMELNFTIQKLQQRLDRLQLQNRSLSSRYEEERKAAKETIEDLKKNLDTKKADLQRQIVETGVKAYEFKNTQAKLQEQLSRQKTIYEFLRSELDSSRATAQQEIRDLKNKLAEADRYLVEKEDMVRERSRLAELLEVERAEKDRALADKDREKAQATDKLKRDMLDRIHETKQSLLALKREQIETTSRLTVLQNHQLTTELQYQSKQTQKLLAKNQQLTMKLSASQRDIQIHKQVEQELVKRSHFGQKLVKSLTAKVKKLEDQLQRKKQERQTLPQQSKVSVDEPDKKKYEIVQALERNTESLEKRMSKLQNDYDILLNENAYLQSRLEDIGTRGQKLARLLIQYFDQILQGGEQEGRKAVQYDLRRLKAVPVQEWTRQEVEITVKILLDWVKPILKKKDIDIPRLGSQVTVIEEMTLPRLEEEAPKPERKTNIKSLLKDIKLEAAAKIVRSNLREWGKGPNTASGTLSRKFKISST